MMGVQPRDESWIVQLLASEEFRDWYETLDALRAEVTAAKERVRALARLRTIARVDRELDALEVDETVFQAAELESRAAAAEVALADIENRSFEQLSAYEQQRMRATQAWAHTQKLEKERERNRDVAPDDASRVDSRLREARLEQRSAEERRDALWASVQSEWERALQASLELSEYRYLARRTRRLSERLLSNRPVRRRDADDVEPKLAAEQEVLRVTTAKLETHRKMAERQFGCLVVSEFLYWPHADETRLILLVALSGDREHLNIQVDALRPYRMSREHGLAFVEPAVVPDDGNSDIEDEARLAAFFASK